MASVTPSPPKWKRRARSSVALPTGGINFVGAGCADVEEGMVRLTNVVGCGDLNSQSSGQEASLGGSDVATITFDEEKAAGMANQCISPPSPDAMVVSPANEQQRLSTTAGGKSSVVDNGILGLVEAAEAASSSARKHLYSTDGGQNEESHMNGKYKQGISNKKGRKDSGSPHDPTSPSPRSDATTEDKGLSEIPEDDPEGGAEESAERARPPTPPLRDQALAVEGNQGESSESPQQEAPRENVEAAAQMREGNGVGAAAESLNGSGRRRVNWGICSIHPFEREDVVAVRFAHRYIWRPDRKNSILRRRITIGIDNRGNRAKKKSPRCGRRGRRGRSKRKRALYIDDDSDDEVPPKPDSGSTKNNDTCQNEGSNELKPSANPITAREGACDSKSLATDDPLEDNSSAETDTSRSPNNGETDQPSNLNHEAQSEKAAVEGSEIDAVAKSRDDQLTDASSTRSIESTSIETEFEPEGVTAEAVSTRAPAANKRRKKRKRQKSIISDSSDRGDSVSPIQALNKKHDKSSATFNPDASKLEEDDVEEIHCAMLRKVSDEDSDDDWKPQGSQPVPTKRSASSNSGKKKHKMIQVFTKRRKVSHHEHDETGDTLEFPGGNITLEKGCKHEFATNDQDGEPSPTASSKKKRKLQASSNGLGAIFASGSQRGPRSTAAGRGLSEHRDEAAYITDSEENSRKIKRGNVAADPAQKHRNTHKTSAARRVSDSSQSSDSDQSEDSSVLVNEDDRNPPDAAESPKRKLPNSRRFNHTRGDSLCRVGSHQELLKGKMTAKITRNSKFNGSHRQESAKCRRIKMAKPSKDSHHHGSVKLEKNTDRSSTRNFLRNTSALESCTT